MKPQIPEPKYEAFIIRNGNVGVQVHAFAEIDTAMRTFLGMPPQYELQIPGGRMIALVGSIESARAILPENVRARQSAGADAELWTC